MTIDDKQGIFARPVTIYNEDYASVRALYREAFPAFERFALPTLRLFAWKPEIEFMAYYDSENNNELCGITYTIDAGKYLYILYLAVRQDLRGKRYGTRILNYLKNQYPQASLVLEIEPLDKKAPNYEQRKSRLSFYNRNGFKLVGYDLFEGKVRYTMLATDDNFDPVEFSKAMRKLSHGLYRFKILPSSD